MKRPFTVGMFTIIVVGSVLWSGLKYFRSILVGSESSLLVAIDIFSLLLLIPMVIMIVKFFMLKKSAKIWVHVSYGLGSLFVLVALGFMLINTELGTSARVIGVLVSLGISVFLWWAIVDYINKKQVDGKPLFS
tara:strand:+ start:2630 stop:3031 length:402 start_codon:yes stop_codon:yes gene_type:complete